VDHEKLNETILPAVAGFTLLNFHASDGEEWIERQPIVGWAVEAGGKFAEPITPDCHDSDFAILYPDGQVVVPFDRTFDTLDEWLAHERKCAAGAQQSAA
jgi:hypothetical protein